MSGAIHDDGGVLITNPRPSSSFVAPSKPELRKLMQIVFAAHPKLQIDLEEASDPEAEFRRAFLAIAHMRRLPEPVTRKYFAAHCEAANQILATYFGAAAVSGSALLAAIIAHNDVPWTPADRSIGQMLECGLDPYHGRPCSNAWRDLLEGHPLLSPTPSRYLRLTQGAPPVTVLKQDPVTGQLRQLGDNESMWG